MNFNISVGCITNRGKIRTKNEDNLYLDGRYLECEHRELKRPEIVQRFSENISCFAVFDGIGGEAFGNIASYLAAREFDTIKQKLSKVIIPPKQFLKDACLQMNRCICKRAEELNAYGMGTTASILYFFGEQFYVCNVGDSPIFRLHDGELRMIYEEHTNRELLKQHGIKGRTPTLTQSLGIPEEEMKIEPYIAKGNLHFGDQFLICSDGLTNMVSVDEICSVMKKTRLLEACIEELLYLALENGGRDNITMILCRVE